MSEAPQLEPSPAPAGRAWPWLVLVVFSVLVMAAHFLRFMVMPLALFTLLLPLLLFFRRTWAVRAVQVWLALGTVMWGFTTRSLVLDRLRKGEPWLRLALIMGTVTLLAFLAVLAFETRAMRRLLRR